MYLLLYLILSTLDGIHSQFLASNYAFGLHKYSNELPSLNFQRRQYVVTNELISKATNDSVKQVECSLSTDQSTGLEALKVLRCQPRKMIVPVTSPFKLHQVLYLYPSHIEVNWCTGACGLDPNAQKNCIPLHAKTLQIPVTAVIIKPNSETETRCYKAEVQEHASCNCDCSIQESHCQFEKQIYNKRRCRCECRDKHRQTACQNQGRFWDPVQCECKCPETLPCSTGYLFHPDYCTCVKVQKISKQQQARWRKKLKMKNTQKMPYMNQTQKINN